MAIEYAGYTPAPLLDIAGLTSKLADQIGGVGERRANEKANLETLYGETLNVLDNPELTESQTYNTLVLKTAQKGRDQLVQLHKDLKAGIISPADYKVKNSNMQKSMADFATASKTYDERYKALLDRRKPDENGFIAGSEWELDFAERYGRLADIVNSELDWTPDGSLRHRNIKTGEEMSLQALNKVENAIVNRVDVNSATEKFTKNWENNVTFKDLGRGGWMSVEDFKANNPDAALAIQYATESILASPKAIASVLVDTGGLTPLSWTTEQERDAKYADAVEKMKARREQTGHAYTKEDEEKIKNSMFHLVEDSQGLKTFDLTDEQKKLAVQIVQSQFDAQLETIIKGGAKQDWYHAPSYGGSGGGRGEEKDLYPGYAAYVTARQAWTTGDWSKMNNANTDYKFVPRKGGGVDVYRRNKVEYTEDVLDKEGATVGTRKVVKDEPVLVADDIKQARDLAPFIYGVGTDAKGSANSYRFFDAQQGRYYDAFPEQRNANQPTAEQLINKYRTK